MKITRTLTVVAVFLALSACAKPEKQLIPVGVFPTPPAELMVPPAKLDPITVTPEENRK